jgi:hypothetical protein
MGLMADYFQSSPNFVNPSYATPEQLATQRAYAEALTKRSGGDVNRPTGAIANMITALTAGMERNRANEVQSQAAEGNSQNLSAMISQLQGGQKIDPENLGHMIANPMSSPEQRALAIHLMTPKPVEDVAGRPGYASPVQGVKAAPVSGGFQPGFRAPETAGNVSTVSPIPAPGIAPTGPAMPARAPVAPTRQDVVNPQGRVFGGTGFTPANGGFGQPAPPASVSSRIDALAAKDRELSSAKAVTQGGAEAQAGVNQEDIRSSSAAPAIIKDLGIIKGIIQTSPGITFGPTAQMTAEAKRVIANYAPVLVDEKSLAGADAIEKLNFGLAGQLARSVGGTQGELFKAIGATPGTEKSKQGTLVLIDMLQQKAMKDQQVGQLYRQMEAQGALKDYPAAREKFLTDHPVTNPLTGKPVQMDIAAARQQDSQGAYEKTATNPQTKERMGLRNGRWEPIK